MTTNPFDQTPRPEQPAVQRVTGQQSTEQYLGSAPMPAAMPPIDIVDGADTISVYVDVPGYADEEIELRGDETSLVLLAERVAEFDENSSLLVHERPTRFERHIQLPAPVHIDEAEADYDDGVCAIEIPKAAAERYKRIDLR